MKLENIIELFYGNTSKIINFYWYLDCDTIMSCMKINKYFYNKKKLLYKLMISYLGMYPHCLYNNFSPPSQIYYNYKYYTIDEITYLIHIKIRSNNTLNKNSYLINRFKILMKHIRLDKLHDNNLRNHYHYTNSLSSSLFSSAIDNNSVISCV